MGDGPSDEEASASSQSQPSYQLPNRYARRNRGYSDEEVELEQDVASPPPPPPSRPPKYQYEMMEDEPPPPPPPRSRRHRHGRDRGGGKSPSYPTTIEIQGPRSRIASRAGRKVHAHSYSYDDSETTGSSVPSSSLPSAASDHVRSQSLGGGVSSRGGRGGGDHGRSRSYIDGNYESFPAPSVNNSLLESSMDESQQKSAMERSVDQIEPSSIPSVKKARGQVLVHYHPQLGDEGYESTLLDTQSPEDKYSRVTRAMNAATRREDGYRPPKHVYPPSRGMHTRMIDDLREDEYNHSPSRVRSRMTSEGNDEYNNAATRQIRRRVFRVAMERGAHDERRRKMLDADADIGGPSLKVKTEDGNEDAPFSPASTARNGYTGFARGSGDSHIDEGDMPLTPGKSLSHSFSHDPSIEKMDSLRSPTSTQPSESVFSPMSPPSPPTQPPSYRTLVHNLISQNEPEKLSQLDRVMEKYSGREEELIKKLDLRYRRRRMKRELASGSKDSRDTQEMLQQPSLESNPSMESAGSKPTEIKAEVLTSPAKLTFIKVDQSPSKERSAIMAMQSWGRSAATDADAGEGGDELVMPPAISKKSLPAAITESSKTDLHSNMDDDNSGMIPAPPKVSSAPNVQNLGNQVLNERMQREKEDVMKERLERGRQREMEIARATSPKPEDDEAASPAKVKDAEKEIVGGEKGEPSPRLRDDYSLKMANSYGDGISVITMETKSTLLDKNKASQRIGGGEAVYSFDEMLKRPPNSITVESGGSNSNKGEEGNADTSPTKLARVVPEVETEEEKAKAAEAAAETSAALDDVEARIKARHKLREEEAAVQQQKREEDAARDETQSFPMSPLKKADDELSDVESLFREAKSKASLVTAPIEVDEPDAEIEEVREDGGDVAKREDAKTTEVDNEEEGAFASPPMIESILSSFDECDAESFVGKPRQPQSELQTITSDVIDEEPLPTSLDASAVDHKEPVPIAPVSSSTLDEEDEEEPSARIEEDEEESSARLEEDRETTDASPRAVSVDDEDNKTVSTTGSRLSATAERAIAAATQTELQRQKDVAEFQSRRDIQSVSASSMGNDELEEEIARLIAEKESRFQAEKAVALMKAQRELEAERRARLEAEAARLKAEEELERLKLEKEAAMENKAELMEVAEEEVQVSMEAMQHEKNMDEHDFPSMTMTRALKFPQENTVEREPSGSNISEVSTEESSKPNGQDSSIDQKRLEAEAARLRAEQELQRLKLEKMASEAEAARHEAEEDLERLKLEKSAKEAETARLKAEEELEILKMEQMWEKKGGVVVESRSATASARVVDAAAIGQGLEGEQDELYPEIKDQARLEAEASRIKAEKELQRLKLERAAAMAADEEVEKAELERLKSELDDEVVRFRRGYSSDDDDDSETKRSEVMRSEATGTVAGRANLDEESPQSIQTESAAEESKEIGESRVLDNQKNYDPQMPNEPQDSNRSSPELEDPPTISRTPEKEVVILSRGSPLIIRDSHDSPLTIMAHAPKLPMEPEPDALELDQAPTDELENEEAMNGQPLGIAQQAKKMDEHDFPSTTMAHIPAIVQESEPATIQSPGSQVQNEEEGGEEEAQIHHVARATFEGDPSKGQLSFTTGSKIEASSKQRGPWWLGRCGGRTGWFPASAVVPASEFLGSVMGSPASAIEDVEESEDEKAQLSGDELNAVYDLIRNPSDPAEPEDDVDSDDGSSSPAKNRWLGGGNAGVGSAATLKSSSRDHSPPPSRLDPSEMAGLSQRLYGESNDDDSRSNTVETIGRSPSPISNGEVVSHGNLAPEEIIENQSKDEPSPTHLADTKDASQPRSEPSENTGTTKDSPIKAAAVKPKPKPEWRATKDPKSGLIYYYHTGTRETTWERPPDYVPLKHSPKGKARTTGSKDKPFKGRIRGIRGFLNKITKAKHEPEYNVCAAEKSPDDALDDQKVAKDSEKEEPEVTEKVDAAATADSIQETPKETEPQDKVDEQAEKLPHPDTESPQKDFWLTLDDAVSASGDDESEHSDTSEGTETSLFSKQKIKTTVGKWAGKITEKLASPVPYETLNDSIGQNEAPESLAIDQLDEKSSAGATSNDDPVTRVEEPTPIGQSKDATEAPPTEGATKPDDNDPLTAEDRSEQEDKPQPDKSDDAKAAEDEMKSEVRSSDKTAKASNIEATEEELSKSKEREGTDEKSPVMDDEGKRKKTQWRSAIDAATGRTYYYIRGTQKVTWEKPSDL